MQYFTVNFIQPVDTHRIPYCFFAKSLDPQQIYGCNEQMSVFLMCMLVDNFLDINE